MLQFSGEESLTSFSCILVEFPLHPGRSFVIFFFITWWILRKDFSLLSGKQVFHLVLIFIIFLKLVSLCAFCLALIFLLIPRISILGELYFLPRYFLQLLNGGEESFLTHFKKI